MERRLTTSEKIADQCQNLGRGNNVITLVTKFSQSEFIKQNQNLSEKIGKKEPFLKEGRIKLATDEGYCAAAVTHWLGTEKIPAPSKDIVEELSKLQDSLNTSNERDYWLLHGELAISYPKLKFVKNGKNLNLDDNQVLINYLIDNGGKINNEFRLFIILFFGNNKAHAVGLNFKTREFFDPNSGVYKIETNENTKDPNKDVKNIAYLIFGLRELKKMYSNVGVLGISAITYTYK